MLVSSLPTASALPVAMSLGCCPPVAGVLPSVCVALLPVSALATWVPVTTASSEDVTCTLVVAVTSAVLGGASSVTGSGDGAVVAGSVDTGVSAVVGAEVACVVSGSGAGTSSTLMVTTGSGAAVVVVVSGTSSSAKATVPPVASRVTAITAVIRRTRLIRPPFYGSCLTRR